MTNALDVAVLKLLPDFVGFIPLSSCEIKFNLKNSNNNVIRIINMGQQFNQLPFNTESPDRMINGQYKFNH